MSIRWDPQRDHRGEPFLAATLCCWQFDTNLIFWSFLCRDDHFQLQAVSISFHIACIDIVQFLDDSDSETSLARFNPQDADR